MATISVVIPTRNDADMLAAAVCAAAGARRIAVELPGIAASTAQASKKPAPG